MAGTPCGHRATTPDISQTAEMERIVRCQRPMSMWAVLDALLGGVLIGAAASALLVLDGRIAGVSGIVGGLIPPRQPDPAWRALFVAGLAIGGFSLRLLFADPFSGLADIPNFV